MVEEFFFKSEVTQYLHNQLTTFASFNKGAEVFFVELKALSSEAGPEAVARRCSVKWSS